MRLNPLNVPMIPESLRQQLFPGESNQVFSPKIRAAKEALKTFELDNLTPDTIEDVEFQLPPLQGSNLEEHFQNISRMMTDPWLSLAEQLAASEIPEMPEVWLKQVGWTRYEPGKPPESVYYPTEPLMVFDVETAVTHSNHPIMATAASSVAWYGWVSTALFYGGNQFCPLGNEYKFVVGHSVSYDRARVLESYSYSKNNTRFFDTLAMHMCVSGISSKQRPQLLAREKARREDTEVGFAPAWMDVASMNSLKDVVRLHLGEVMDKDTRDIFVKGSLKEINDNFDLLIRYNADDVAATYRLFRVLWKRFREKCPHNVTFAGMLTMGTSVLPINQSWHTYIQNCTRVYAEAQAKVEKNLHLLADKAIKEVKSGKLDPSTDPWLRHFNWELPGSRAKLNTDKPEWYRDLWDSKKKRIHISTSKRATPYLLRLSWMGYPLFYKADKGWGYLVPSEDTEYETSSEGTRLDANCLPLESTNPEKWIYTFYKIPHAKGERENVGNPLSKDFLPAMENGTLSSEYDEAKEALDIAISCSYFKSCQARVHDQFPVFSKNGEGIIIPSLIVSGTVTRRAVERLWLTASSAKKNRIGSEIKTCIRVPEGYVRVGGDIDSEELWLSDLLGEMEAGIQGGTPSSMMTLMGKKEEGTDLHSRSAKSLGTTRDNAKTHNYARRYGSGLASSVLSLRQWRKELSLAECKSIVTKAFQETKGKKFEGRWYGGSESTMFNAMEKIANSRDPRTLALGCGISDALHPTYVGKDMMTSRVNWTCQSAGVDFLHLWLTAVDYLCKVYDIPYIYMISIHDESHWMVKKEDSARMSLAVQIGHLWTRAFFCYQAGLYDLPASVAWMSGVDIDFTLRKDVNSPCITPSQPVPLPLGFSKDIYQILQATGGKLERHG